VIAIIDYGRGNLGSVERVIRGVGVPAVVTQDPRVVDEADAVVFPGDGAFHDSMRSLAALGLLEPVRHALEGGRPFLGICIGYQLLFSASEEFGEGRGLDAIPGVVRRFPAGLDVPHMGWNRVWHGGELRLFEGIPDGAHFYFVHSYYPVVAGAVVAGAASPARTAGGLDSAPRGSDTPTHALRQAWCDYGVRFAAAIERGHIHATQFHPEKSGKAHGVRLLENFAALVKEGR
jgi:glutamine amidotransferase